MSNLHGTSRQALAIIHGREVGSGTAKKSASQLRAEIEAARASVTQMRTEIETRAVPNFRERVLSGETNEIAAPKGVVFEGVDLSTVTEGWITYREAYGDGYDTRKIEYNTGRTFVVHDGAMLVNIEHAHVIGFGASLSACLYSKERTLSNARRARNGLPPLH